MTELQQQIMIFMQSREETKCRELAISLGAHRTSINRALDDLRTEDFIEVTKGTYGINLYSLTTDGMSVAKRLIRYHSTEGQIVQPSRINKMSGTYTTTPCYQRNDGRNLQIGAV